MTDIYDSSEGNGAESAHVEGSGADWFADDAADSTMPDQGPATVQFSAVNPAAFDESEVAALGTGRKAKKHTKLPWIGAAAILLLVIAALVGGFFAARSYYNSRVAPGVSLGTTPVTGQDRAQLTRTVAQKIADSKVTIGDGTTTVSASLKDLGVSVDADKTVNDVLSAKSSNDFARLNPVSRQNVDLDAKVNRIDLDNFLSSKFVAGNDQARPSTISFDATQGIFVPSQGSAGRAVIPSPVEKAVASLVANPGRTATVKVGYHTTDMPISMDAANAAATQANVRLNNPVVIDNGNGDTFKVPGPVVASWIKPNGNLAKGEISLDYDKTGMLNYLNQELPKQLNRKMVTQEDVVDDSGKVLGTVTQGVDGVSVKDVNAVSDQIYGAMTSAQPANVHAAVDVTKHDTQQKKSEYRIVVDKSAQMVYVYKGDQQIKSFQTCTGKAGGDETDNGNFFIYLKYQTQDMRGFNDDGSKYLSPGVKWVSYFNGGEGFHTADWNYSGIAAGNPNANGSHGCVNMYEQDAQWIYQNCGEGTFVQVVGNQPTGAVR